MAITAGTYTVGTGGDYTSFNEDNGALAAIGSGTLTGNLTLVQISDTTESKYRVIAPALAGYTLKLTSNKPHGGNITKGWTVQLDMATSGIRINATGAGVLEYCHLKFKQIRDAVNGHMLVIYTTTGGVTDTLVHDLIFDGNRRVLGPAATLGNCLYLASYNYHYVWNILITNGQTRGMSLANSARGTNIIENVLIHDCVTGIYSTSTTYYRVFRNVACLGNSTADYASTSATMVNCASSDAGSADILYPNCVTANELVSTSVTDPLFGELRKGGSLFGNGTLAHYSGNVLDIRGRRRPDPFCRQSIGPNEADGKGPNCMFEVS